MSRAASRFVVSELCQIPSETPVTYRGIQRLIAPAAGGESSGGIRPLMHRRVRRCSARGRHQRHPAGSGAGRTSVEALEMIMSATDVDVHREWVRDLAT